MATAIHSTGRTGVTITWIAFWLLFVGGLNWGLVGLFDFNLVAAILGDDTAASRVVYTLVGLAALYCAYAIPALRKRTDI